MTKLKQSDAAPVDLDWPEPLVIDIVSERFPDIVAREERMALARLQAQALREAYAGRDRRAAAARVELIAYCAARCISTERIARVDLAVFHELSQIASTRFRTSPRLQTEICRKLAAALERIRGTPRAADGASAPAAPLRSLATIG